MIRPLPAFDPERDAGRNIGEDVIKLIAVQRFLFKLNVISLVFNLVTLVGLIIWWLE